VGLALLGLATLQGLAAARASSAAEAPDTVRVFAAASLTNVLTELGHAWADAGHPLPSLAFAASGTLAKQIEAGAPADLFASADAKWMDYLDSRGLVDHASRRSLLATTLVLVQPVAIPGQPGPAKPVTVQMRRNFPIAKAFEGSCAPASRRSCPQGSTPNRRCRRLGGGTASRAG